MNVYADSKLLETLNKVRSNIVQSSVDDILEVALVFAGTMAAIKIIINVLPIISNPDKEWDFAKILTPVFLAILLLFYPSLINLTRSVMGTFERITINAETLINKEKFIVSLQDELFAPAIAEVAKEEKYLSLQSEKQEFRSLGGKILDSFWPDDDKENIEKEPEHSESWAVIFFKHLLLYLSSIIKSIILNIRNALLVILEVGGPLAICMSLIPTLEGSFKKWFGVYIHIYLWYPVCTIIDAISLATFRAFQEVYPGGTVINFIIAAVFLVTYILVPKITSYFIDSRDAGLAMSAGINKAANMVSGSLKKIGSGGNPFSGDIPSSESSGDTPSSGSSE